MTVSKKIWALFLILALLVHLPLGVNAQEKAGEPELISEGAVLMDASTGQILYGKNMDEQLYPASITKIMTGYLALKYGNPSDELTLSQAVVDQVPRTSSHISLLPGEVITLEGALYALALVSANDAAVAIAEYISGSVEAFAELMNQEAEALGAHHTHFVNANGMPASDHYTTARDMALITAEALKMPDFLTYFGGKSYTLPATNLSDERELVSKNKFVDGSMECAGLLMSKTGWTSSALGTLVTAAKQGSTTLIAVAMKSPILEDKYTDTQSLFRYGFEEFQRARLSGSLMAEKMHQQGMDAQATLEGYSPVDVLLPKDVDSKDVMITVPGGFDASLGLSTVPVSVDVQREEGGRLHITDLLLTIVDAQPLSLEDPEPVETASVSGTAVHPGFIILLVLAVLFALGRIVFRRKVHP